MRTAFHNLNSLPHFSCSCLVRVSNLWCERVHAYIIASTTHIAKWFPYLLNIVMWFNTYEHPPQQEECFHVSIEALYKLFWRSHFMVDEFHHDIISFWAFMWRQYDTWLWSYLLYASSQHNIRWVTPYSSGSLMSLATMALCKYDTDEISVCICSAPSSWKYVQSMLSFSFQNSFDL